MKTDWIKAKNILKSGGVIVIPTDTLYGLVASVYSKKAIEKIYKIKERDKSKALIVLISSLKDLEIFGIKINNEEAKFLLKMWPGKVSIILPCKKSLFKNIHCGLGEIAFRMIGKKNKHLSDLIKKIGPIVAPSANIEAGRPAETIKEAHDYFGKQVDLYINAGKRISKPSTLIRYKNCQIEILRAGATKIKLIK